MEKINGGHFKVLAKSRFASSIVTVASTLLLISLPPKAIDGKGQQNDAITKRIDQQHDKHEKVKQHENNVSRFFFGKKQFCFIYCRGCQQTSTYFFAPKGN